MDPDYTGSFQVLLLNLSSQNHAIEVNHCIAQLILEKVAYPILCEVPEMLLMEHGAQWILAQWGNECTRKGGT